ncbi:MAG: hypothetical protein ABIQ30_06605 [Devosia sp.]
MIWAAVKHAAFEAAMVAKKKCTSKQKAESRKRMSVLLLNEGRILCQLTTSCNMVVFTTGLKGNASLRALRIISSSISFPKNCESVDESLGRDGSREAAMR